MFSGEPLTLLSPGNACPSPDSCCEDPRDKQILQNPSNHSSVLKIPSDPKMMFPRHLLGGMILFLLSFLLLLRRPVQGVQLLQLRFSRVDTETLRLSTPPQDSPPPDSAESHAAMVGRRRRSLFRVQLLFDQPLHLATRDPCTGKDDILSVRRLRQQSRGAFSELRSFPKLVGLRCSAFSTPTQVSIIVFQPEHGPADDPSSGRDEFFLSAASQDTGDRLTDLENAFWFRLLIPEEQERLFRLYFSGEPSPAAPEFDHVLSFIFQASNETTAPEDHAELSEAPPFLDPSFFHSLTPETGKENGEASCELLWRRPSLHPQTPAECTAPRQVWLSDSRGRFPRSSPQTAKLSRPEILPRITDFDLVPPSSLQPPSEDTSEEEEDGRRKWSPDCEAVRGQQKMLFVETHVKVLDSILGPVMDVAMAPIMDQFISVVTSGSLSTLNGPS